MRCADFMDAIIFVTTLPSQTKILEGRTISEQTFQTAFPRGSTFQLLVAQVEYSHTCKVLRKRTLKGLFGLPKSSFGRGKLCNMIQKIVARDDTTIRCFFGWVRLYPFKIFARSCFPNEDCGWPDQLFRMRFQGTFRRLVFQVEYSHP
jgi:hypothetical protein